MKVSRLNLTAAVVLALGSSSAFAIAPSVAPEVVVRMSGATAPTPGLESVMRNQVCASSIDGITFNGGIATQRGIYCQTSNSAALPVSIRNKRLLWIKIETGGSANGVFPPLNQTNMAFMNVNAGCAAAAFVDPGIGNAYSFNCTTTTNLPPNSGISDVDAGVFLKRGPSFGGGTLPPVSQFTTRSAGGLIFGLPVTTNIRNALQRMQIANGTLAAGCAGQETEACMPNMPESQVASIMAGDIVDWTQIRNGTTDVATEAGLLKTELFVCRRVATSGTQASHDTYWLNFPGTPFRQPADRLGFSNVIENSGSGNVEICMDAHDDVDQAAIANGVYDPVANTGRELDDVGTGAVGVLSTDFNVTRGRNYRFVKIDGHAPTVGNVWSGNYRFFKEVGCQYLNTQAGTVRDLTDFICARTANPATLPNLVHSWGRAGSIATCEEGFPISSTFAGVATNPVTPYSHVVAGILDNTNKPAVNCPDPAGDGSLPPNTNPTW